MYLSDQVVRKGLFFTPGDSENKYPGVLTISNGGGIELEITSNDLAFTSFDNMEVGRLIGMIEGGYVTLEGCEYRNKSISFPGYPTTSRIEAEIAFIGAGLNESDSFLSMKFGVDGLSEWWGKSAFNLDHGSKFEDFTLTVSIPDPVEFSLQDGTTFKLLLDATIPGGRKFPTLEFSHQAFIQITPAEPKPAKYFTALSHKITRFFALVIGRSVAIHSLKIELNDAEFEGPQRWLSVYFRSLNNPSRHGNRLAPQEMLLTHMAIASRFEPMLSNWLKECDNLGPALHHYYLIQDDAHSYADTRFISMAQALEAFHRRTSDSTKWPKDEYNNKVSAIIEACPHGDKEWLKGKLNFGNEITLAERLGQMFAPYVEAFGGGESVRNIIKLTKDTRNYHAHYDAKGAKKAAKGSALVALTFRLQALFALCILVRLGFSPEEAVKLTKSGALARLIQIANNIDRHS